MENFYFYFLYLILLAFIYFIFILYMRKTLDTPNGTPRLKESSERPEDPYWETKERKNERENKKKNGKKKREKERKKMFSQSNEQIKSKRAPLTL